MPWEIYIIRSQEKNYKLIVMICSQTTLTPRLRKRSLLTMTIDILYAHSDAMCHRVFEYVKMSNGILLHCYLNVEIYLQ